MVQSGFTQASNLAFQTSNSANTLVNEALATVNQYNPKYPSVTLHINDAGISSGGGFNSTASPPGFPVIRDPKFPVRPTLGALSNLDADFTGRAPSVTVPPFHYMSPAAISPFSEPFPTIDASYTAPDKPTFAYPTAPTLVPVDANIPIDPVVVPPLNLTVPNYDNLLDADWHREFEAAWARAPRSSDPAIHLIDRQFPGLLGLFESLRKRVLSALDGTDTALTTAFDDRLYQSMVAKLAAETVKRLNEIGDASTGTGWALPGAVRRAGESAAYDLAARLASEAAREVYLKRAEREVQHLQFCMELAARLYDNSLVLYRDLHDSDMKAFEASIKYADAATGFALRAFELRQRDFEVRLALMRAEIEAFEALLKAQLAKVEVAKIRLEAEKLKSDVNDAQVRVYVAQLGAEETKARVYVAQIGALKQEIELRMVPLEIYRLKLDAHKVYVDARRAEYGLIESQIAGDKAKLEGELAKLRVYETELSAWKTEIEAKSKQIDVQAKRNDQLLAFYKTDIDAQLALVKVDEARSNNALDAYKAMAGVFIAEQNNLRDEAKFKFEKTMRESDVEMKVADFDYEVQYKNLELEMARLRTMADLHMDASRVKAGMASSALSAMNAIVSASVTEQK